MRLPGSIDPLRDMLVWMFWKRGRVVLAALVLGGLALNRHYRRVTSRNKHHNL
jgi:hypothetical protein